MPQKKIRLQNRPLSTVTEAYYVGAAAGFAVQAPHDRAPAGTIEARLERKAQAADRDTLPAQSLGQLDHTARHKLLYGGWAQGSPLTTEPH